MALAMPTRRTRIIGRRGSVCLSVPRSRRGLDGIVAVVAVVAGGRDKLGEQKMTNMRCCAWPTEKPRQYNNNAKRQI